MKEAMMENTPLFSVLTEEQRSLIADRMTLEMRRAGDLIYQAGRPATAIYLIKSGWARLVTDQLAVLANVSAGSLLGDADVLSGPQLHHLGRGGQRRGALGARAHPT